MPDVVHSVPGLLLGPSRPTQHSKESSHTREELEETAAKNAIQVYLATNLPTFLQALLQSPWQQWNWELPLTVWFPCVLALPTIIHTHDDS